MAVSVLCIVVAVSLVDVAVPWVDLWSLIVAFRSHTHFPLVITVIVIKKDHKDGNCYICCWAFILILFIEK